MSIRIDPARCTRCGLCVDDCTSRVFRMAAHGPVVHAPQNCNRCSHCLAVCPVRAIHHPALTSTHPPRVRRASVQPQAVREAALSRRSVRRYKPDPVPRRIVEEILDTARYAPTASNAQNVHYTVITRRALLDAVSRRIFGFGDRIYRATRRLPLEPARRALPSVAWLDALGRYAASWQDYREQVAQGRDLILHHAPALILLHTLRGEPFGRENAVIAATHIDLLAHAMGMGTCHIGILTTAMAFDPALRARLRVPRGHRVHAALTLGFPAFRYPYRVARNPLRVRWVPEPEPATRAQPAPPRKRPARAKG